MKETGFFYAPRRSKESPINPVSILERETPLSINLERAVGNLDDYLLRERFGINKKPLVGDQIRIFKSIRDCLADGITEGYIKAPPGYGKTLIYAKLADALGLKTLIVVPTTPLINQVADEIGECTESLRVGKVYSAEKVYDKQITVITYNSFLKGIEDRSINPKDYGCLILDEGHLATSKRRQNAVGKFDAIKIGFTATPEYSKEKKLENLLPTKICDISLKKGIQDGRLSNAKGFVVMVYTDHPDKSQDKGSLRVNALMQAALNFYLNHSVDEIPIKGQRTLAYCETIADAERLAELFRESGIPSEAITGKDNIKNKTAKIGRFKNGEIAVGTTVDLLGIGYDDPGLKVCLFISNTFSSVKAEQRIRNLRKHLNDKNKLSILADFFTSDIFKKSKIPVSSAAIVNGAYTAYDITSAVIRGPNREKTESNGSDEIVIFEALDFKKTEQVELVDKPFREDVEQAFEVVQTTKPDFVPEDVIQWKTFADIASELKITEEILLNILRERGVPELDKHGNEWRILEVVDDAGKLTKRLSPSLEDWLGVTVREYKTFPIAGGKCVNDVLKELNKEGYKTSYLIVKESFLRVGVENPEERGIHKHPGTRKNTRYLSRVAADLVKKDIIENKLKYPSPPKDWPTITKLFLRLKKRYSARYEFVKSEAAFLKEADPEGFGLFRSSTYNWNGGAAGIYEYMSPENAAKVEARAKERFMNKPTFPPKGEGWKSPGDFRKETGIHDSTAKKRAEVFRNDHPEWFHVYSNNGGRNSSEHWNSLLQAELKKLFGIPLAGDRTEEFINQTLAGALI